MRFLLWGRLEPPFGGNRRRGFQLVSPAEGVSALVSLDRGKWSPCLLWHGWLPGFGGISDSDSWASSFGDLAFDELELFLGASLVDFSCSWTVPDYWDAADIALEMSEYPNIWTDGSSGDFSSLGGLEVAGAGVYLLASEFAFGAMVWGTAEKYGDASSGSLPCFSAGPWAASDCSAC